MTGTVIVCCRKIFCSNQYQCFGSKSGLEFGFCQVSGLIRNPDPGGQKSLTKIKKKLRKFMFWSAGCSLLRAEGFSCNLGVLYGGLWISKLHFLIKKYEFFPAVIFFSNFWSSKPWIRIAIQPKMLDPDPDSINPETLHLFFFLNLHIANFGRSVFQNSATYWEGNCEAESLQRIYGISFPDTKLLKEWKLLQVHTHFIRALQQCCRSGMFIPDTGSEFFLSRILMFSIPDPPQRI